jgi:hypothetical protein
VKKLQEKPSALKSEHTEHQNMKFSKLFAIFVGHFCPPGSAAFPMGYGTDPSQPKSMWIQKNPDPKHFKITMKSEQSRELAKPLKARNMMFL